MKPDPYYSDDPIWSKQVTQAHNKFPGEQVNWFCATSKDIMDDVVVSVSRSLRSLHVIDNLGSVPYDRSMIFWKIKILCSKVMHDRVDLNRCGIDSMSCECSGCCTNAYTSERSGQLVKDDLHDEEYLHYKCMLWLAHRDLLTFWHLDL